MKVGDRVAYRDGKGAHGIIQKVLSDPVAYEVYWGRADGRQASSIVSPSEIEIVTETVSTPEEVEKRQAAEKAAGRVNIVEDA